MRRRNFETLAGIQSTAVNGRFRAEGLDSRATGTPRIAIEARWAMSEAQSAPCPSSPRRVASRPYVIGNKDGNGVVEVFRNDFAVRMLEGSSPAGFEVPIRSPYGSEALDAMAGELDTIFAAIAADASGTSALNTAP